MIDLHCHILPGIDDGASSLEDSVAMARQAEADGIAVVCATPHIRSDHDVRIEDIGTHVEALQRELTDREIGVRVAPGGELAESEADRLTDGQLRVVSLGGSGGWLLLEPAPGPLGDELERLVQRLAARGFGTVIAHPERHASADFEQRLSELSRHGCLIQWTAEFLARSSPGDIALRLASGGLVHLLGSDAHSAQLGRPVQLAAGFAQLATVCTSAWVTWMIDQAPRAILRGEPVSPPPP